MPGQDPLMPGQDEINREVVKTSLFPLYSVELPFQ